MHLIVYNGENLLPNSKMEEKNSLLVMKHFQCIVIWTFNDDHKEENYQKLLKILKSFKFEEIDQSTQGSQDVDIQKLIDELKNGFFIYHKGDFIKIAHTSAPGGIMVQEVEDIHLPLNEEHARMLELINYKM